MPIATRADVTGAVIAFLKAQPAVTALVNSAAGWNGSGSGSRISARRQGGPNGWKMPTYAVLVQGRFGGGEDGPLHWQRFQLVCYGPDDRTADLLWRTLDYAFCPEVGSLRANGFVAASTSVAKVEREVGPLGQTDPDTAWESVMGVYRVFYAPDSLS